MTRPADTVYRAKGSLLIDHIDGDYFNVVGLPLVQLYKEFKENGINIMDFWK